MAIDVTHIVKDLHSRQILFGISFEQLTLLLYIVFLVPVVILWYRQIRRTRFAPPVPAGCTKLGLSGASHTSDEFDKKYDTGTNDQTAWKVKAVYVYPIKSCAGVELDVADVDGEGMTYDRKFAFVEWLAPIKADENGEKKPLWTFRTLRAPGWEKLALIRPEIWVPKKREEGTQYGSRKVEQEGRMIIWYPNVPTGFLAAIEGLMQRWGLIPKESFFQVPLHPGKDHKYPIEKVNVWKDNPEWINMGEHIPNDFKQWLGMKHPISLFAADPQTYRQVFRNAPRQEQVGFQPAIGFQDSYPLHLLNITSVHDVGARVGDEIPRLSLRRFRGNIILQGPPIYDEDSWKRVRVGDHELYCSCHTTRCLLPCVDPDTAERHPREPNKTLVSYRKIDPGDTKAACLGLQSVPASNERFQVRVGDSVQVLERGEHYFISDNSRDYRVPPFESTS